MICNQHKPSYNPYKIRLNGKLGGSGMTRRSGMDEIRVVGGRMRMAKITEVATI